MFVVADPEEKTCHGILTVRKVFDIDNERMNRVRNLRKRRAPDASVSTVVNERKGRRFECGYCGYESRAQYIKKFHNFHYFLLSLHFPVSFARNYFF